MLAASVGGAGCREVSVTMHAPTTANCLGADLRTVRVVAMVGNTVEFRATVTSMSHDTPSGDYFLDPTNCACHGPGFISDTTVLDRVDSFAVSHDRGAITLELGLIGDGVDFDLLVCALEE